MIITLSSILFIALFWISWVYVSSKISFIIGLLLMTFLVGSIFLSVKFILNKSNPILGILLLFSKAPILVFTLFYVQKLKGFDNYSFMTGVLILLPSLVLLSYRK